MRKLRKKNMWDIKRQQGKFVKEQKEGKLGGTQANWLEDDFNNPAYINDKPFGLHRNPYEQWIVDIDNQVITLPLQDDMYVGTVEGLTDCQFINKYDSPTTPVGYFNEDTLYKITVDGKEYGARLSIWEDGNWYDGDEAPIRKCESLLLNINNSNYEAAQAFSIWYNGEVKINAEIYKRYTGEMPESIKVTIAIGSRTGYLVPIDTKFIPQAAFPNRIEIKQMIADAIAELQNT